MLIRGSQVETVKSKTTGRSSDKKGILRKSTRVVVSVFKCSAKKGRIGTYCSYSFIISKFKQW